MNKEHLAQKTLVASPYPSVSAWVNGNSRLPRSETGNGPILSNANYVDVHFMGNDRQRDVFTAAPNETQRAHYYLTKPFFATDALKATLEIDDPKHFEVLATSLTSTQWDQLTLAANLSESYPWGGAINVNCWSFDSLLQNQDEDVRTWAKEIVYRFTNCNPANTEVFHRKFCDDGELRLELNCRDFIIYLHHCDALADVLSPLCDPDDKCRDMFAGREFENLGEFYESIRPAADLYRSISESVIKSFIEVGGAFHLVNDKHKEALLRLDFAVSDVGYQLDDNPAHADNDSDGQIEEWWKWSEGYFDYKVNYGLTPMSPLKFLEKYTEHIKGACIAFDPSIRTNTEVLKRLDDGWNSRGFNEPGPIIKNLESVHADLVFIKELLEDALHHCRSTAVEFVLPTRLQTPCKPMPKLPARVEPTMQYVSDTAQEISEKINTILGVALGEGKRILVTGEEQIRHHFHCASAVEDGIIISYGSRRTATIKKGAYAAEISKEAGRRLLRTLDAKATLFQCRDLDDEPLNIQIL